MSKCPFCGEPSTRECAAHLVFRCGTTGPDVNGNYVTGRICDMYSYQRLLVAKDEEIARLRARVAELEKINRKRFISTMSFGAIQGDGTVKVVEYRHECTLCGAESAELELIEHEADCPLRAAGGD